MINVTKNKYGIINFTKLSSSIFILAVIFSLPFFHNLLIVDDKFTHSYKITLNEDLIYISKICSDKTFSDLYSQISDRINREDTSKMYSFIDVNSAKFATPNSTFILTKVPISNDLIFWNDFINPLVKTHFNAPVIQELYADCLYDIYNKNQSIIKLTKNSYNNISFQKNYIILKDILSSKIINQPFYKIEKNNIRNDNNTNFLKIILASISFLLLGIYFSLNFSLNIKK